MSGAGSDWQLTGLHHVCLTVSDVDRSIEFYQELRAKGVSFKSEPVAITSGPNEGGFVVYLHDPDGYTIELFQPPVALG